MILEAEADLVPMGPRSPLRFGRCRTDVPRTSCGLRSASVGAEQTSPGCLAVFAPLRSAQSRHPPDVLRSSLRFGRRRADIPRMSCAPSSARLRLLRSRRPWFKVSPPARSLQNRRPPPDVLQPVFRKASVVAWQAPVGPRSRLCTLSSALKWGKLNYTDFVQNCILDQKERTSL